MHADMEMGGKMLVNAVVWSIVERSSSSSPEKEHHLRGEMERERRPVVGGFTGTQERS